MQRIIKATLLGGLLLTASCVLPGSARMVQRNQTGGVIALTGDHERAMGEAHDAMTAHCGNYEITDEREVVVGSNEVSEGNAHYDKHGATARSGTQTRDATEYRMTYRCTQAASATAPTTPGGAPGTVQPAAAGTE